ncbi:MAG: hypothetical protein LBS58_03840 [Coriobacteriales bacterium]|jgi:glucose-6-phosphate isomerase|nr:hypothetical protein [Coriobacteriales bacterium]
MVKQSDTVYCACLERLLALKAASRLAAKDATLFSTSPQEQEYAARYLGWTSLSTRPPLPLSDITSLAAAIRAEGLEAVVLIGQGGSSQASMTVTKLHELTHNDVAFRTMDSLSPVFVNHILGSSDPARTLYIVSSKSGGTVEPLMLERVAWRYVSAHLGTVGAARRFVAITDPGSGLEQLARDKNYRTVLNSPVDVGGRFSALSVFTLLPAALVGIDLEEAVAFAADAERACVRDDRDNPALKLACFLHEGYLTGRDKFSLVIPPSGQVFGLWVEQLVAESLGKDGKGILPNVEVDASILSTPRADRTAITYEVGHPEGFAESIANFDPTIPVCHYTLNTPKEVFARFVVWEYAIAFLGILLEVNPFDQPDVEITKELVKTLLASKDGLKEASDFATVPLDSSDYIRTLRMSNALLKETELDTPVSVDHALRMLLGSLRTGDYFSLNAFLPFRGYGRREALERMRNRVASRLGVASCLEIGPRYLHSTGQLHKGGPNTGVFLFISADEDNDIAIPGEDFTLGGLAAIQAQGDFTALASRDRRALHIHLAGNDSETLSRFADRLCAAVSAVKRPAE